MVDATRLNEQKIASILSSIHSDSTSTLLPLVELINKLFIDDKAEWVGIVDPDLVSDFSVEETLFLCLFSAISNNLHKNNKDLNKTEKMFLKILDAKFKSMYKTLAIDFSVIDIWNTL